MRSILRLALALSAALSTAPTFTGKALAAADQTLGMALMSALINSDGSIVRGAGAVSSTYQGSGEYRMKFNRSLADCVTTVTPWFDKTIVSTITDLVNDEALVTLGNTDGLRTQGPFHVIVFCSK